MLQIQQISALKDNFVYFLICSETKQTAVIDPSEATPVLSFLQKQGLTLSLILNTHHHYDHVGGNAELVERYNCPVFCHKNDTERTPGATRALTDGEVFQFAQNSIEVIYVPGHTLGAISFYLPKQGCVFTGDTLFTLGCGRLFEGTHEQLFQSLARFKSLPPKTQVYGGHEYGAQNGQFALSLNPDDTSLRAHTQLILTGLKAGRPSSPSPLADELRWNPFLTAQDLAEFTRRRQMKDEFKLEVAPGIG